MRRLLIGLKGKPVKSLVGPGWREPVKLLVILKTK
jgi:hypothetical protein